VPRALAELAPLRYYAEYARRYAARDLDAFIELFDEDWTMVDHRTGGAAEPIGTATCRAWTASVFAVSPDVRFAIDEVLACSDRVVAIRASYRGQGPGGSLDSRRPVRVRRRRGDARAPPRADRSAVGGRVKGRLSPACLSTSPLLAPER
jgi:hypothetical protein